VRKQATIDQEEVLNCVLQAAARGHHQERRAAAHKTDG
jgi:hypothetical protein